MNSKKVSLALFAVLTCFFVGQSASAAAKIAAATSEFQLLPAINLWGYTGEQTIGDGQMLFPLRGGQNDALLFVAEGKIGNKDNGWMAGAGAAYRQVMDQRILGGYVLANYNTFNNAFDHTNKFWVINPGIESLGLTWDFRVNGYIPFSERSWSEHKQYVDFEDNCGIYDGVHFAGHSQYDYQTLVKSQLESVTGLGADAEIGRTIPLIDNLKGFIGGYYFDNKNAGHVGGGSARITWQATNNLGVEVIDTFDNKRHNTAMVGIRFTFGGFKKDAVEQYGISARLMDPIEHNIATASNGYAVPIISNKNVSYDRFGAEVLQHDNVWFFKQGATDNKTNASASSGDGTYENPYVGFDQANVSTINPNIGKIDKDPLLYFAPGTYNLTGADFVTDGRFSLPLGWGMYGRDDDYAAPAFADQRAQFIGGIDIKPAVTAQSVPDFSQATTLNSIQVFNDKPTNVAANDFGNSAVYMKNAGDVIIKNSAIESNVSSSDNEAQNGSRDATGIYVGNSKLNFAQLDCRHDGSTTVDGITDGSMANGVGIFAVATDGVTASVAANATQQDALGTTEINFLGGVNNIAGQNSHNGVGGVGIEAIPVGQNGGQSEVNINFNDGTNTISATEAGIYGFIMPIAGSTANLTINFNGGENAVSVMGGTRDVDGIRIIARGDASINVLAEINFNGGENIISATTAHARPASAIYTLSAAADREIGSNIRTEINFNGGENILNASSQRATVVDMLELGSNVTADMNFTGGKNKLSAAATGERNSAVGINAAGGLGAEANVRFSGGENNIFAVASGNNSIAAGIFGSPNITFENGENTLSAAAGDGGLAFGIRTIGGTVDFENQGKDKVNIIANAGAYGSRFGISMIFGGNIIVGGVPADVTNISEVANFISNDITSPPDAVVWAGHDAFPGLWQLP